MEFVVDLNLLLIRQDGKFLLMRRANTGYCDGQWSLVGGHPEACERFDVAAARELQEEVGLTAEPERLRLVHVMQRQTAPARVSLFFLVDQWSGVPTICEPHKCDGLLWTHVDGMPAQTVDYIGVAMRAIQQDQPLAFGVFG